MWSGCIRLQIDAGLARVIVAPDSLSEGAPDSILERTPEAMFPPGDEIGERLGFFKSDHHLLNGC